MNEPAAPIRILELDRVSVMRGSVSILKSLSLSVARGDHTAILGPNGSGKSTLLKLLMRHMYPSVVDGQCGTVRIFGQTEWNVWELRTQLGFVSSELDQHFIGGRSGRLTALQAVLTGIFSSELEPDPERVTPAMIDDARRAMALMEIEGLANRPVGHFSTGERRRVMLARAMIHQPQALVLDEPTAGLDLKAQDHLLRRLEVLASTGTTVILVTHHFEEIVPCIRRTILMSDGGIAFDGGTDDAMQEDRLERVFQCPLRLHRTPKGRWRVFLDD